MWIWLWGPSQAGDYIIIFQVRQTHELRQTAKLTRTARSTQQVARALMLKELELGLRFPSSYSIVAKFIISSGLNEFLAGGNAASKLKRSQILESMTIVSSWIAGFWVFLLILFVSCAECEWVSFCCFLFFLFLSHQVGLPRFSGYLRATCGIASNCLLLLCPPHPLGCHCPCLSSFCPLLVYILTYLHI